VGRKADVVLRKIGAVAVALGGILTLLCVQSHLPDAHAVIQGTESVEPAIIGEIALCGAPIGLGFVFAVIAALAAE